MPRKRNKQINVRLTEEEYKYLQGKVKLSKLNKSNYVRRCLLEKDIVVIEGLKDLLIDIKQIGNSINYLKKAVNSGKVNDISNTLDDKNSKYNEVFAELMRVLKKV